MIAAMHKCKNIISASTCTYVRLVMATGTSSASEYRSREKRQLIKKLIQEILCQLEQVNPDQLLERVKANVSSGVQER